MAIMHFQFESIHPFYDGNGRTGRIINILYLILPNLPILYLSSYIMKRKSEYYRLLQCVRETNNWNDWIIYMVDGIEFTAIETIQLIKDIKELMLSFLKQIVYRIKETHNQGVAGSSPAGPTTARHSRKATAGSFILYSYMFLE
jgi:Fic family protein